jgi:hypothetical protein
MFDPDPAFQRFAAWCEVEATRRMIVGDPDSRTVGGMATLATLVMIDPRRLHLSPEDAARERARALDELALLAGPLGFRVDADATVDAATGLEVEITTKGMNR